MALLDAVARGDLEAVKKLMGKKPKKGELVCETCGTSVLSKATEKGDISIVQFLLGRDDIFRYISEKNKLGYTAWDLAQKYGHDEVAKLISWRMTGEAVSHKAH